jgi:hypothetical protein
MLPFGEDGESPGQERERLLCSGVCILGHMGHMGQDNMGLYHVLTGMCTNIHGIKVQALYREMNLSVHLPSLTPFTSILYRTIKES